MCRKRYPAEATLARLNAKNNSKIQYDREIDGRDGSFISTEISQKRCNAKVPPAIK